MCLPFRAREKGTNRETRTSSMKDSAQEKVPVTQTLSFCQMHFLSPLPVAFDRKLVSVFPFLGVGSRARPKKDMIKPVNHQKEHLDLVV